MWLVVGGSGPSWGNTPMLYRTKNTVVVYTDESYVNANHAASHTWYHESMKISRPSGRGKRLIILHAVTKYDPLVYREPDGTPTVSHSNISKKCLTAELILEAVQDEGDYHKNMNGDIYMKWLKNRLFPTFKKVFLGQNMALV